MILKKIKQLKGELSEIRDLKMMLFNVAKLRIAKMGFGDPPLCTIAIEPTNKCNLSCKMCYIKKSGRITGFMDFDLFKKIIDQLQNQLPTKSVFLSFGGEPTLHPRFLDMVQYASDKGIGVHITTNGTLLTEKKIDLLLNTRGVYSVRFSIDGFKESYEKIRVGANYETVIKNTKYMLQRKKELGLKLSIGVCYTKSTQPEDEEEKFIKYWKPLVGTDSVAHSVCIDNNLVPIYEEYIEKKRRLCHFLWDYMTILWNGDIALCCNDIAGKTSKLINRNLNNDSIIDIWTGEEYRNLRKEHRRGIFRGLCMNCKATTFKIVKSKKKNKGRFWNMGND